MTEIKDITSERELRNILKNTGMPLATFLNLIISSL